MGRSRRKSQTRRGFGCGQEDRAMDAALVDRQLGVIPDWGGLMSSEIQTSSPSQGGHGARGPNTSSHSWCFITLSSKCFHNCKKKWGGKSLNCLWIDGVYRELTQIKVPNNRWNSDLGQKINLAVEKRISFFYIFEYKGRSIFPSEQSSILKNKTKNQSHLKPVLLWSSPFLVPCTAKLLERIIYTRASASLRSTYSLTLLIWHLAPG